VKVFFRKGKLEGMVEQYWPGGQIQFRHRYVNNLRHGECLDYFENGALKSSVTFDKGVQAGPYGYILRTVACRKKGRSKMGLTTVPSPAISPGRENLPYREHTGITCMMAKSPHGGLTA